MASKHILPTTPARRQSSKRELYTSPSYRPHTLQTDFPLPSPNLGGPEPATLSWPGPAPPARTSPLAPEVPKREMVPEPKTVAGAATSTSTPTTKPTKTRRTKLRPRKAALKLTPAAVEHLHDLLDQPDPQMIRVGVKNRGCSGLAYHLEYVNQPGPFDEVVEQDGVKVLIDSKALFSIIGSEMDWHEDQLSARFVFRNPNITEQDFSSRAFTIGIGGPVGSGKTALMLELCLALRDEYNIAALTNDIFTREDAEFLTKNGALVPERIVAIETGGCPHAAVREDISANLLALEGLQAKFGCDLLLIESGGDNLAANYSRELADFIIYVIDVAGGDKVPRKGGPGITGSDLLVINKCDLADAVGADVDLMETEALKIREGGPTVRAVIKNAVGVKQTVDLILSAWRTTDGYSISRKKWAEGAPRGSGDSPVAVKKVYKSPYKAA
ncbi:hypothetical protein DV735_g3006, partial [Chaetothyriales sp. CBS 134920]